MADRRARRRRPTPIVMLGQGDSACTLDRCAALSPLPSTLTVPLAFLAGVAAVCLITVLIRLAGPGTPVEVSTEEGRALAAAAPPGS